MGRAGAAVVVVGDGRFSFLPAEPSPRCVERIQEMAFTQKLTQGKQKVEKGGIEISFCFLLSQFLGWSRFLFSKFLHFKL